MPLLILVVRLVTFGSTFPLLVLGLVLLVRVGGSSPGLWCPRVAVATEQNKNK